MQSLRPAPEKAPPRPLPPATYAGPRLKADRDGNLKLATSRDERFPLAEAIRLVLALDDPAAGPRATWPRPWPRTSPAARRDAKPETRDHLRAAILNLAPGVLEALIRDADRPKIREPANRFAATSANEMKALRSRRKRTG